MSENQDNKDYLVKVDKIGNTPFDLVTNEKGRFIALGKYKLTEDLEGEAEEWLEQNKWELILNICTLLIQANEEMKGEDKNV